MFEDFLEESSEITFSDLIWSHRLVRFGQNIATLSDADCAMADSSCSLHV